MVEPASTNDAERAVDAQMRLLFQKTSKIIHKLVINDHKWKVHELADIGKISDGSVFTIYTNFWVCESSVQSGCRVSSQSTKNNNESMLQGSVWALLNRNKMEFYCRYVTMDETWLHYYTPEVQ